MQVSNMKLKIFVIKKSKNLKIIMLFCYDFKLYIKLLAVPTGVSRAKDLIFLKYICKKNEFAIHSLFIVIYE